MPRERGTYAIIDNWARKLAPTLPGAAGWVLLELSYQSNYTRPFMRVGDLINNLPYKVRSIEVALAYLVAQGHVEAQEMGYCLRGACAKLAQETRKTLRSEEVLEAHQEQEVIVLNPAIELHKKKEEKEEKEQPIKTAAQPSPRPAPVRSVKPKAEPKDPTAFQLLFEALAVTCYGGHDGLTAPASSRIGSAAKVLMAAGYAAPDVPLIAAWIGAQEKWRTGTLSPQTIAERAPAWKQGVKASAGKMPKSSDLDDQDWAEESRMADERRFLGQPEAVSGWN